MVSLKKMEQDQGKGLFQEINVKAELKHEYEKGIIIILLKILMIFSIEII